MILAMNFDFGWFLTIPGMLITGGVLLLVIALIIFIATSSKKDKNKNQNAEVNEASQMGAQTMVENPQQMVAAPSIGPDAGVVGAIPEMSDMGQVASPMDIPPVMQQPMLGMEPMPMVSETPVMDPTLMSTVPEVAPVTMEAPAMDVNPIPVADAPLEPLAPTVDLTPPTEPAPYVVSPVQENISAAPLENVTPEAMPFGGSVTPEVAPEITPVEQAPVNVVSQPEIMMPEAAPMVTEAQPTIYGGASPLVPEINVDNQSHQIYGGADPLENTQAMSVPVASDVVNPAPVMPEMSMPSPAMDTVMQPEVPVVEEVPQVAVEPSIPTVAMEPAMPEITPVQEPEIPVVAQPETVMPEAAPVQMPSVAPVVEMTTPVIETPVIPTVEPSMIETVPVAQPEVVAPVQSEIPVVAPTSVLPQQPEVIAPQPAAVTPAVQPVTPIQATVEATAAPVEVVEIA